MVFRMELAKKIRRFQNLEPTNLSSPVVLFFVVLALAFFLLCFLYLDFGLFLSQWGFSSLRRPENVSLPDFLTSPACDVFEGSWVMDDKYPLYHSRDCEFLDEGFRCAENGRPDDLYTKWRWQPQTCNLPRFNANMMLEKLRNQRLAFVGDSIGRNQWESLLCMLSSAIANKSSVYEVNGSPITKHNGYLIFKFHDYNCTLEYYRAPFLVFQGHAPKGSPAEVKLTLKLDIMDWTSPKWKNADVLVLNTGHWWNYEKTLKTGCYFEEGKKVIMNMSIESAYRRTIETVINWIEKELDPNKTRVLFRTYAPVHFSGGDWNNGGSCHLETFPEPEPMQLHSQSWIWLLNVVGNVLANHQQSQLSVEVMNVTRMSSSRKDAHSSIYYVTPSLRETAMHRQDCSHWCLPGVPDAWNELLYALILRWQTPVDHPPAG